MPIHGMNSINDDRGGGRGGQGGRRRAALDMEGGLEKDPR